jgi:hypothetical protein
MSATPLLRPLRNNTGTLYVFKSAANHLGKTFTDDNLKFNFSKFVALDLPESKNSINNLENILCFQALGNRKNPLVFDNTVLTDLISQNNLNTAIANSIQSNLLNWETVILNKQNNLGETYTDLDNTVSERIFWRWLSDLGAVRFQEPTSAETDSLNLFIEELENNSTNYKKVVKYLGDISLVNNINKGGDSYSEIYLHIPTEHGSTPDILFKNIVDVNYGPGYIWESGEFIEGRTSTDIPNMSIKSYNHDNFEDGNNFFTLDNFSNTTNTDLVISNSIDGSSPYNLKVSNLDGLVIDWDKEDYKKIVSDANIDSFADFNSSANAKDFEFNTVLIYYDIVDVSNPSNISRNLYGILFLEDFNNNLSGNGKLKGFRKFKPNEITRVNGNSYSLKTNIKFNANNSTDAIVRSINEYTTFSMDLFSDAMVSLQNSFNILNSQSIIITNLQEKIDNLEKFYYNQSSIQDLKNKVTELSASVNNALLGLESPSTLLELIRKNSERISSLVNGNLGTLSYDLSPFKQGSGIKLDKSTPGRINIHNTVEQYNNISTCLNTLNELNYTTNNGDTTSDDKNNILTFGPFTNYYKNKTDNNGNILSNNLVINIQDKIYKFKKGQVFKIYFDKELNLSDTSRIVIYTDSENKLGSGSFKWLIGEINSSDLISSRPIIEIVCTDENLYTFDINILK